MTRVCADLGEMAVAPEIMVLRKAWSESAVPVREAILDRHRFDILDDLADPHGRVHGLAMRLLRLAAGRITHAPFTGDWTDVDARCRGVAPPPCRAHAGACSRRDTRRDGRRSRAACRRARAHARQGRR
jgi:hypothetical protein